jgi:large subunit ribosomal protein L2
MSPKSLKSILKKKGGRSKGEVTVRHQGGGQKHFLRKIDFRRDKENIPAKVIAFEYDPNRNSRLALVLYKDGEKRYILAPEDLKIGEEIIKGRGVEVKIGNCLPLAEIPIGLPIHNLELTPGKGGQIIRSAGALATILSKEGGMAIIKLASGETRKVNINCWATIGQVGNINQKNLKIGKAGRKIHLGIRPTVRGTAQNPHSHPHGGGEGRSGIGMPSPKTPWGKKARGKKTRNRKKYSQKFIIKRIN